MQSTGHHMAPIHGHISLKIKVVQGHEDVTLHFNFKGNFSTDFV